MSWRTAPNNTLNVLQKCPRFCEISLVMSWQTAERLRPRVMIVGGTDVDRRLDLMHLLSEDFDVEAAGSNPDLVRKFVNAGFPYHYYPLKRGPTPIADLRSMRALKNLFRRRRPDIVHAFATKPTVWGRLAASATGAPVVVGTVTGLGSLYTGGGLRRKLTRAIYGRLQQAASFRSELTIFQNRRDHEELIALGIAPAERSTVMCGSGVKTDWFDAARVPREAAERFRSEVRACSGTVVTTMISRVIRSKGVLEFVETAERLRFSRGGQVRFVLVGPDDRASTDRLNHNELERVRQSVVWLGPRKDVREILAGSDIFVLPTFYREGIPRVLLEAASMGLPLVTTKVPGCEDVVDAEENGCLVLPRDVHALTAAIERLVEDPLLRQRFAVSSRRIAVQRFDLAVIADATRALYLELLRGSQAACVLGSDVRRQIRTT